MADYVTSSISAGVFFLNAVSPPITAALRGEKKDFFEQEGFSCSRIGYSIARGCKKIGHKVVKK